MFLNEKIRKYNVLNSQNSRFQFLQTPKSRTPMFGKAKMFEEVYYKEFQCLEKPKFRIPMLIKPKFTIPMFG